MSLVPMATKNVWLRLLFSVLRIPCVLLQQKRHGEFGHSSDNNAY